MTIPIAVINESAAISDADVAVMIPAFQTQWSRDLAPAWSLEDASFVVVPKTSTPAAGSWWVVFLDDSDQAGALAYHDVTDEGLPISKVFVKTIIADSALVSVGATHEICEMAVDPTINLAAQDAQGLFWAYEVCDPVEDDQYGYEISGTRVTDFALPAWFGYQSSHGPWDFQKHTTAPFQVLSAGYAQNFGAQGWQQVTGKSAAKRKVASPPDGSRRMTRRTKHPGARVRSATAAERAALRV